MLNHIDHPLVKRLNDGLDGCQKCKEHNTTGGAFISANQDVIDVMFIAQNPGASWFGKKVKPYHIIPFGLDEVTNYNLFFDCFKKDFMKRFQREPVFYITNVVKCSTEDNSLKSEAQIKACIVNYLWTELRYFKEFNENLNIITLGKEAQKAMSLFGDIDQVTNLQFAYHPGYLNRKGKAVIMETSFELVSKLTSNGKI